MTGPSTRRGADSRCGACRAPVIRQLVDVLTITADPEPIPPGTDHQHRTPNRLTWCAPPHRAGNGPPRLRWIYPSVHPPDCPHPHHAEHHCTTPRPPADPSEQPDRLF